MTSFSLLFALGWSLMFFVPINYLIDFSFFCRFTSAYSCLWFCFCLFYCFFLIVYSLPFALPQLGQVVFLFSQTFRYLPCIYIRPMQWDMSQEYGFIWYSTAMSVSWKFHWCKIICCFTKSNLTFGIQTGCGATDVFKFISRIYICVCEYYKNKTRNYVKTSIIIPPLNV